MKPGGADYISGIYTKRKNPGEAEKAAKILFYYYPDTNSGTINGRDKHFTCEYDSKKDKTTLSAPSYFLTGTIENKKGITRSDKVNYAGRDSGMCKTDIISGTYEGMMYGSDYIEPRSTKVQYDVEKGTGALSDRFRTSPFACLGNKLVFDNDIALFDKDNIYFPWGTVTNKVQEQQHAHIPPKSVCMLSMYLPLRWE